MAESNNFAKRAVLIVVGVGCAALAYEFGSNRTTDFPASQTTEIPGLTKEDLNQRPVVLPQAALGTTENPGSGAEQRRTSP